VTAWSIDRHGAVAVATFVAPPRNFMTFAQMTELEGHVTAVGADESIAVLVIASGLPGYFISHGDLEDLVRLGTGEPFTGEAESWPRVAGLLAQIPQIAVAAIDGRAGGGGCEFSLTCDLRVAGPGASFDFPEVSLGMIPGGGGTQRMPRLIGAGRAAEMILTGRSVGAEEALRLGIVDALLGDDPFLDAVRAWAGQIAAQPRPSLIAAKRAIRAAALLPLADGLAREAELVGPLLSQPQTLELERAAIDRYRTS
jgi:enoyl-CoA hydratase/carnithine racemase